MMNKLEEICATKREEVARRAATAEAGSDWERLLDG
jgi:hypothetical protein